MGLASFVAGQKPTALDLNTAINAPTHLRAGERARADDLGAVHKV